MEKMGGNGGMKNSRLNLDAVSKMASKGDNKKTEAKKTGATSGKLSLMKAQEVSPNGKV